MSDALLDAIAARVQAVDGVRRELTRQSVLIRVELARMAAREEFTAVQRSVRMDFDETLIGMTAGELSDTARWRREKAVQYPDDARNAEAADLCDRLAAEVFALQGTDKAKVFETMHDFIFQGEDDTDDPMEVIRLWSEYRSGIGFRCYPETGAEYLDELMSLARDAA